MNVEMHCTGQQRAIVPPGVSIRPSPEPETKGLISGITDFCLVRVMEFRQAREADIDLPKVQTYREV